MKNLVISGASKGIGKAIVLKFASEGWNVAFCSRNMENLLALENELEALAPQNKYLAFQCDVSMQVEVKDFAHAAEKFLGDIDLIVNNAGVFIPGSLHELDDLAFSLMMQTNLTSAFTLTKNLIQGMKERKSGSIFNMSSIAGLHAYPNGGAYNVSKHAMTGFSKTLRDELKDFNIKVCTLYPGATLTDSWAGVDLPAERFIKAEDIAQLVYDIYHLSPNAVVEDVVIRPQLGDV